MSVWKPIFQNMRPATAVDERSAYKRPKQRRQATGKHSDRLPACSLHHWATASAAAAAAAADQPLQVTVAPMNLWWSHTMPLYIAITPGSFSVGYPAEASNPPPHYG